MKFGGTCLNDGTRFLHAAQLIENSIRKGDSVVVVVSAMTEVTNSLITSTVKAADGDQKTIINFIKTLLERHKKAASEAIHKKTTQEKVIQEIEELVRKLEKVLISISYLRETTPRSYDYILSFGEKLSTIILRATLEDMGLKAQSFTGGEAGIVTDDHFSEARPLMNITCLQVRERLSPLLMKGEIAVVSGFIAYTQDGITTTLGRGSSDYTATILASSLNMDEVWIWTDVDGLMTADPTIVPLAKTIPVLSYPEAMEMVYFGAKAIHPKALEPAVEKNIPIRVKNVFNPSNKGTLIVKEQKINGASIAKTIAIIKEVALITVNGAGMIDAPGVAAKVFNILGENRINVLMISQSSSQANISFIILQREVERALNFLELGLLGQGIINEVLSDSDVCIIAIVGAGMKGTPGVAAKVFQSVAEEGINIMMIAQGSSELNISFVVKRENGIKVVNKLHHEFQLN